MSTERPERPSRRDILRGALAGTVAGLSGSTTSDAEEHGKESHEAAITLERVKDPTEQFVRKLVERFSTLTEEISLDELPREFLKEIRRELHMYVKDFARDLEGEEENVIPDIYSAGDAIHEAWREATDLNTDSRLRSFLSRELRSVRKRVSRSFRQKPRGSGESYEEYREA